MIHDYVGPAAAFGARNLAPGQLQWSYLEAGLNTYTAQVLNPRRQAWRPQPLLLHHKRRPLPLRVEAVVVLVLQAPRYSSLLLWDLVLSLQTCGT